MAELKSGVMGGLGALLSKFSESYGEGQDRAMKNKLLDAQLQALTMKNPLTMISALTPLLSQGGGMKIKSIGPGGATFGPSEPTARALNEKEKFDLDLKKKQLENQSSFIKTSAQDMLDTIQEVKKGIDYFGPLGNVPTVPVLTGEYDKRKNWEVNVNKLLSGKIIDLMAEMKNASKTGATGFGQLSEKELAVLQGASTALKRDLAPKDAARYLNDLENANKKILSGGGYQLGQEVINGGKKYKVVGLSDPNDPDLEEVS